MKQRRALILYATMSSNTEKIAQCFADVFDAYNWDVTTVRIRRNLPSGRKIFISTTTT